MTDPARSGVWHVATAQDMDDLGECLGRLLLAGDVVLLDGELGAGKTTLTRGIARGLGVTGPVTSPTFIIAREHPPRGDVPGLVHVDAYRLTSPDELDDLDLAPAMARSVTVVEWAGEVATFLHPSPLRLVLEVDGEAARRVSWSAEGERWADDLSRVAGCGEGSSRRSAPGRPA